MSAPPVLPGKTLQRVLAIARADGWSIAIVAGLSSLVSLVQGAWFSAAAGILATLAGLAELHGRSRLLQREPRGLSWLVGAQLGLLVVVWIYAWARWRFFDPEALWTELPTLARTLISHRMTTAGLDPELDRALFLGVMNALVCLILAGVTLLYQGGLALYYAWQRAPVRQALAQESTP